jgi:hypothetical protein
VKGLPPPSDKSIAVSNNDDDDDDDDDKIIIIIVESFSVTSFRQNCVDWYRLHKKEVSDEYLLLIKSF